jgi:hypothetical protein
LFSGAALSEVPPDNLNVIYSGISFKIPKHPVAIGHIGRGSDSLIIKYSRDPGNKYISISKEVDLNFEGCSPNHFFEMILSDTVPSACEGSISAFREIFVKNSSHGAWLGSEHKFYYFIIGDNSSFIFSVLDDGLVIKFESDFLVKSELKEALLNNI